MHLPQALLYRLQEIFIHKTQAVSKRRVEEKCLVLLKLNSSNFLGESAGVGLAGGHRWEQRADVCLFLCIVQWGIIKNDAAFVQLRDAKVP